MNTNISLIKDYINGLISPETNEELQSLFVKYPTLKQTVDDLISERGIIEALKDYNEIFSSSYTDRETVQLNQILHRINTPKKNANIFYKWKKYIAVASILLILGIGWLYLKNFSTKNINYSQEIIAAGTNKAYITLEDGQIISLNGDEEGIVVENGIKYNKGQFLYKGNDVDPNRKISLSTPRGGQYTITLSDGTKVWLNADSKLIYPLSFGNSSREVALEGEAYFEVAKDSQRKFIVNTSHESVEVLGTHFNINSYSDASNSFVSLVEGSVKVTSIDGQFSTYLSPNQQAVLSEEGMDKESFNVEECLAWKSGEFSFNNESLENVVKKLERWYDVEIEVGTNLKDIEIWGAISRYEDFDTVMEVIKRVDKRIKYSKIERRKIIMR